MAINKNLIVMVRHLIGDLDITSEKYTDHRIEGSLAVGGLITAQEYDFSTTYTFDIAVPDITPDPMATATYDGTAVALFTLKAACIMETDSYRSAVSKGIKVRDGDSLVDTTSGFKGYADIILLGPCNSYKKLLQDKVTKASMGKGKAVLSPYTHVDSAIYNGLHVERFFDSFIL